MPSGYIKNHVYRLALPFVGMRVPWHAVHGDDPQVASDLTRFFQKHRVQGGALQCFYHGQLTGLYTAGDNITPHTIFRTASIAKMVTALLVFRLQTLGKLQVDEDISQSLGYLVRNPHYPEVPITIGMLLSHMSALQDAPSYLAHMNQPPALSALLAESYLPYEPGTQFRYSNVGAGIVGSVLEGKFGKSLEELAQTYLFTPQNIKATYDVSTLPVAHVVDSYRVLPQACTLSMAQRMKNAQPICMPNSETHYTLAAGNLYTTATELAKLAVLLQQDAFISPSCQKRMKTPIGTWPRPAVPMHHGMGVLYLESLCSTPIWGHQGFAYGSVNGVFFDETASGFAWLNQGASEARRGHLADIHYDLLRYFFCVNKEGLCKKTV